MSEQSASSGDEQVDEFVIEDIETLRILAEPLRMRIHFELHEPRTVKELAAALGLPQTRLYYHIKLLERARLIRVVAKRIVSGIEERTYQTTGRSTVVSPNLAGEVAESGAVRAMFGMVAAELEIALQRSPQIATPDSSVIAMNLTHVGLRRDEVETFQERLFDLIKEYAEHVGEPGVDEYQLLVAAYRRRDAS
jgi:DNA-binding transcriptional ArsR family regulator